MAPDQEDTAWRDRRSEAAAEHARALAQSRSAESARARELLSAFVHEAQARGVGPVRLRARSYDGRARYRTGLTGWYLRRNESVAVDTAGEFYVLSVPRSIASLVRGASPAPSDPPLVLGKGARDGESIDLADALAIALGEREPRTP